MTGMIECCVGWYKRSGEREERVKVAGKSKEKKRQSSTPVTLVADSAHYVAHIVSRSNQHHSTFVWLM